MNAELLQKYLVMFPDCMPVRGAKVSAIYDLTRGTISTFPSEYFPLFERFRTERLGEVLDSFADDDRTDIQAFVEFIDAGEYAVFADEPKRLPEIPSSWDGPYLIENAILDINAEHHDYPKLIDELDALGCQHIQVRAYSNLFRASDLRELISLCRGTSIVTIGAVLQHETGLSDAEYVSLVSSHRTLCSLVLHGAPEDRRIAVSHGTRGDLGAAVEIVLTSKTMRSSVDCGAIPKESLLAPSTGTFNELRLFNGCLNRKISVDESGQIRACPAMGQSFGHHRVTALGSVASRPNFQKNWGAKKDDIKICRDCQYRYACTDCRALLQDPADESSKPLKCGYDPYTDTWTDWASQPGAQSALLHYRSRPSLPVLGP
jgi:SPASM domain peptide maturase of grasp-with-spasm system